MQENNIDSIVNRPSQKRKTNPLLRIWHLFKFVNVLKTIYVNFVCFPFKTAVKLPIFVGYHVQFMGLRRNCIRLVSTKRTRTGMIELGITRHPMVSTKGLYTLVKIHKDSHIEMGDYVRILSGGSLIAALGGIICIGDDFFMNQKTRIYASKMISFGNHCSLGWEVQVMDSDIHYIFNHATNKIKDCRKPVVIGNNCWLANRVSVMKGSFLPDYSILAGGSLLNRDYSTVTAKGNFFSGTPAVLKGSGVYRIFNEKLEKKIKDYFSIDGNDQIAVEDNFDFYKILD